MPAHRRTRREGRTSHGEYPRRGHRHGGHSSSPSLSASVHAPAGPEPVPINQPTPTESPTPEALQAFKAHWESQGRPSTYQDWLDLMQYWSMFGGRGQTRQVPNLMSPSVRVAVPESREGSQPLILSKMVKEARQLGCSTFEGSSDAIVTKQ